MSTAQGERYATILVADDDRSIRTVLHQAMARLGHQVQVTGNVATLRNWVEQGAGDLLITDVMFLDGVMRWIFCPASERRAPTCR